MSNVTVKTKLNKWGTSLGLRIPHVFTDYLKWGDMDEIVVSIDRKGRIVLTKEE